MIFARKKPPPVRQVPDDPMRLFIDDLRATYPYGAAPFGLRSIIQTVVWTVLEMKKRGLI